MITKQYVLTLPSLHRGMHLITERINDLLDGSVQTGTVHVFLQHTSASLCLNENVDPRVRSDAETFLNDLIPENYPKFLHTYEGSDDMPAHMKNMLLGSSLTLPVTQGRLALGTWQGIYLFEHRDYASGRTLIITLQGE
ncbi:secondary thiamine-phosphate synthase enzyme [Sulfurovum lithotrophicum]|uniref:Secondary thiamine-phosphate synthase enzyme n=1 Tax=Sulfurovum lithotrophicum TaxID=206403 RepID=A0A7U4LZP1_9BACT|nr:secondary thiamine-phosphate synthase enzyme YjbQ [Sulfurovum lithotrophicum]AKF24188.1 secondary thiamine-phosphate synthase enzyme [Sulfurovum lithotrophicum]